ncbi:helix-turn-helix domain-containing protein [Actinotignum sp. GS-2025e]|uniref:helix-turn-helix domain-containing protein n=1 Tax=Actinotignum sp. GS-2025e TaxID=3427278 RepID=UPI003F44A017
MASEITRERVVELRRRGDSYGQIATSLGMSRNTVKSICRRADITTAPAARCEPATTCEHCNGHIEAAIVGRRFCCDACRLAWWHAHPERLDRRAIYTFICRACGQTFTAYGNKHRKYCSHPCYIRHRFKTRGGRP